ncbi:MAG: Mur ligase domain-containing protein [Candidatus Saccharibacteria bacterium]|nr:Mur ligase domain-containing protein [Candidatus Saccharibacteria bacterium]
MKIFISGISGTGMGPLALMAKRAGLEVVGSDLAEGAVSNELRKAEIEFDTETKQDGSFLKKHLDSIDWFVYTSALPEDHAELVMAKEAGIRTSKRDELIAYLVEKLGLKMVAIAGTHGKTTTTSMIIWGALKLGIPVSYLVGTTLPFAEAGNYDTNSEFLIYEADEYDRNFLHFFPWLSIITVATYDHPDIYPTPMDYQAAFEKFRGQSEEVIEGSSLEGDDFRLAGKARRKDAAMAMAALLRMAEELGMTLSQDEIIDVLDNFPGAGRRFERITDGVYSDYGHHPEEVASTVEIAKEEAKLRGKLGVVLVYEPHQNTRQHEVREGYKTAFNGVAKLYWLPTYLTRENPDLPVISPDEFIAGLDLATRDVAEAAKPNRDLAKALKDYHQAGYMILLMTAGPADGWLRKVFEV